MMKAAIFIVGICFTLINAQNAVPPPSPSLVQESPFVLDGSRGPFSVECQIEYPSGDTDWSVDMSLEKTVWDAASRSFYNKTLCVNGRSTFNSISCDQTFTGPDETAVKSLRVNFDALNPEESYFPGNYQCKRRARKKGETMNFESTTFQVIDCGKHPP